MLEEYLSNIIQRVAAKYLVDFDSKLLSVTWTKGDISINNLSLNPNVLQDVHPGLLIHRGSIGSLRIKFSIMHLKTIPVVITMDDILLLLLMKDGQQQLSQNELQSIIKEKFLNKLQTMLNDQILFQEFFEDQLKEKKKGKKGSSYVQGIIQAVLNNLKISINNLHLRYEDNKIPCCFGITFKQISISSINKEQREIVYKEDDIEIIKQCKIDDIAIYCCSYLLSSQEMSKTQQIEYLKSTISSTCNQVQHFNYIIKPMSVVAVLTQDKSTPQQLKNPLFSVTVNVKNLNFNLSSNQLMVFMRIGQKIATLGSGFQQLESRPSQSLQTMPRFWINYLISDDDKVRKENECIHKAKYEYSTYARLFAQHYINSNVKEGIQYIDAFKKQVEEKQSLMEQVPFPFCMNYPCMCDNDECNMMLHTLHQQLSIDEIKTCRSFVIELLYGKNVKDLKKSGQLAQPSFYEGILDYIKKSDSDKVKEESLYPEDCTKIEMQLFFDILQLQLNSSTFCDIDVQQVIKKELKSNIEKLPVYGQYNQVNPICQINLQSLKFAFQSNFSQNMQLQATVRTFEIINKLANTSNFNVVSRKIPLNPNFIYDSITDVHYYEEETKNQQLELKFQKVGLNLFSIDFSLKPVSLVLIPNIYDIVNKILQDVKEVSQESNNNMDLKKMIIDEYDQQYASLQNFSSKYLEKIVEEHTRFVVKISIAAPVIIIPYSNQIDVSKLLILNLGNLRVRTFMQAAELSDIDQKMYDSYQINLDNLFIFYCENIADIGALFVNCQSVSQTAYSDHRIILPPTSISSEIHNCFIDRYYKSAKLIINVKMKTFSVNISQNIVDSLVQTVSYVNETLHQNQVANQQIKIDDSQLSDDSTVKGLKRQVKFLENIANENSNNTSFLLQTNELQSLDTLENVPDHDEQYQKEQILNFVKIRFSFLLETISIVFSQRILNSTEMQKIAAINLNEISVQYVEKPYHKHINLEVHEFNFCDNINNQLIIRNKQSSNLVQCAYDDISNKHPLYNNITKNIDIIVNGIIVIVDLNFCSYFLKYVQNIQKALSNVNQNLKSESSKIEISKFIDNQTIDKAIRKLIAQKSVKEFQVTKQQINTVLSVKVDELKIIFKEHNKNEIFCEFSMYKLLFQSKEYNYISSYQLQLNGISLQDYYLNTIYKDVIKTPQQEQPVFELVFSQIDPKSQDFCGFMNEMQMNILNKVEITILLRFIFTFQQYLNDFVGNIDKQTSNDDKNGKKQERKEQETKLPTLFRVGININAPLIIVPINDMEKQLLLLDLGKMNITSSYYIGSPTNVVDHDIATNIPMQEFQVLLHEIQIKVQKSDNVQSLVHPLTSVIKLCMPLQCESCTQAKTLGQLPDSYIDIKIKNEILIQITTESYDFLMYSLLPTNNLGYNTIDFNKNLEDDLKLARKRVSDFQNNSNLSSEKQDDKIHQNESLMTADIKNIDNKSGAYSLLAVDQVSSNQMKLAVLLSTQGFEIQMMGTRDRHVPCSQQQKFVSASIGKMELSFKQFSTSFKLSTSIKALSIEDMLNQSFSQKYNKLLKTEGDIQLLASQSENGAFEVQVNFAKNIETNVIIPMVSYFTVFTETLYSDQQVKDKNLRQKKAEINQAIVDLNNYYNELEAKQSLKNQTNFQLLQQKRITYLPEIAAKFNMPHFQVNLPADPNDDESQVLFLQMEFYIDITSKNSTKQDLLDSQQIEQKDISSLNALVQICDLSVQIVQDQNMQVILSNIYFDFVYLLQQHNNLLNYNGNSIIKREQDSLIRISIENPVTFKISASEVDFFLQIAHQMQYNFSHLNNDQQYETSENKQEQQLDKSYKIDKSLIKDNVLICDAQYKGDIKVIDQQIPIFINRDDVKIQILAQNGIQLSLIDDRVSIVPLFEFIIPQCNMEGNKRFLSEAHVPQQNVVVTFDFLCNIYSQRILGWEPLIEKILLTFTYSFDAVPSIGNTFSNQSTTIMQISDVFQINITPNVIRTIEQFQGLMESIINKTQKQVKLPLLYQQIHENNTLLNDKQDVYSQRSTLQSIEKQNLFKQYRIFNATPYQIQVCSQDDAEQYFALEQNNEIFTDIRKDTVNINVSEGNFQQNKFYLICINKVGIQFFTLKSTSIYMEISMIDRQLYIVFRPRVQILNKTQQQLYISINSATQELNQKSHKFIQADEERELIFIQTTIMQSIQNSFGLNLQQKIPSFCCIEKRNFRLQTEYLSTSGGDVLNISIFPTFVIRNDCLFPIIIDQTTILPGLCQDFYVNPLQDFIIKQICVQNYLQSNFVFAKIIQKPFKENTLESKQIQLEAEQTKILYKFANSITLACNKEQLQFGLKRDFEFKKQTLNQFQHLLIIYPQIILRNLLATFSNYQNYEEIDVIIKSKQKSKEPILQRCSVGQSIHTFVTEKDNNVDILIAIGKQEQPTSAIQVSTQGVNINAILKNEKFQYNVKIEMAKNNISRVISVLPSRIFRNLTEKSITIDISKSNQYKEKTDQIILQSKQPQSYIFSKDYIFIVDEDIRSSAIPIENSATMLIKMATFQVIIQCEVFGDIQYIDFYDKQMTMVEICNQTEEEVELYQCLNLGEINKSKQNMIASIDENSNTHFKIKPKETIPVYICDHSITPVFNLKIENQVIPISLLKVGRRKPKELKHGYVYYSVDCQSDKKIITISNEQIQKTKIISIANTDQRLEVKSTVSLQIQQILISMFQTTGTFMVKKESSKQIFAASNIPIELFQMELTDIRVQMLELQQTFVYQLEIFGVNLNNMQQEANNRNVISVSQNVNQLQAIQVQVEKVANSNFFTMISAIFGDIEINIDQSFYDSGVQYFQQFQAKNKTLTEYDQSQIGVAVNKYLMPQIPEEPVAEFSFSYFYVGFLQISDLQLHVSLLLTNIYSESQLVTSLVSAFSSTLASLSNAEISIEKFQFQNILTSKQEFVNQLKGFYVKQFLKNIGNILKSAFLFGSIADVSTHFGEGVAEIVDSNTAMQRLQGFSTLGKNALNGYFSVISSATTTFSNIAANLTFDQEYTQKRLKQISQSKRNGGNAVGNAFISFGQGLYDGLTGIITQPIQGGMKEGGIGVLKGIGKGLSGIVMKPITGTIDFVSHLSIAAQVGLQQKKKALRNQRVYFDGIIKPLNENNQQVQKEEKEK